MKIDLNKKYVTGMGYKVIHMRIVPRNHTGKLVTYPVKGAVVVREHPLKIEHGIWTIEGIENVAFPDERDNLVEST